MPVTITLTNIKIEKLLVDYEAQCVKVTFSFCDATGKEWETKIATFWITMPQITTPYDFLLPSSYVPTLLSLKADADLALTERFLA